MVSLYLNFAAFSSSLLSIMIKFISVFVKLLSFNDSLMFIFPVSLLYNTSTSSGYETGELGFE